MRFVFVILSMLILAISGCSQTDLNDKIPNGDAVQLSDGHNAMNSLDYAGLYILEGQAENTDLISLKINYEGSYSLTKRDGTAFQGEYRWADNGSEIFLLMPDDQSVRLFVGENYLELRDRNTSKVKRFAKSE